MAVTLRNTGLQESSSASYTVNWPSGSVAGDMAVIHYGGGYAVTSPPAGWNILYNSNQGNWNGLVIWRILTSGDISTGHVVVTPSGTFDATVGIVTVQTGTFDTTAAPTFQGIADTGGASTRSITGFVPSTSDLAIYFASCRANGAVTCNLGSQQQTVSASASASIYTENPGSVTPNPTFSFAATGSGDTTFIVGIQDTRTLPAWLRGTNIQEASATTFTVTWPAGTVSGDVGVIFATGLLLTTPSGWTSIDSNAGANMEGKVVWRTLNSTDISNGNVSVSFGSTFNNTVALAMVIGTALTGYANPVATMAQHSTGATTRTVNYTSTTTSDYAIYFGTSRCAVGSASVSLGTYREGAGDTVVTSAMYVGQPASAGTISPVFSYSNGGSSTGDYQGTALFSLTSVNATVNLVGVAATAAAGAFSVSLSSTLSLSGVAGTGAAGSFSPGASSTKALTGVSGTGHAGSLGWSQTLFLTGVSATGYAGVIFPVTNFLTVPLTVIMNSNPIPNAGTMVADPIPNIAALPYQLPLECILNKNPIPMSGTMMNVPIPGEGSVP